MTYRLILSLKDYHRLMRYLGEVHHSLVEEEATRQGYDLMDFGDESGIVNTVALIKDMNLYTDTFNVNNLLPQSISLKKGVLYGKNRSDLSVFKNIVRLEGNILSD